LVFVVIGLFGLVFSTEQTKVSPATSPLIPPQNPRFVENAHLKEEHERLSHKAKIVVSALKEHEIISVFGHIWNSANAKQRTDFSNAFGAKINKADPRSQIRSKSTTPTIISDFESLYDQVTPSRRVEFVKKTLWDQLPETAQSNLLNFIRLGESQHSHSSSQSSSKSDSKSSASGSEPIRVWTSGGSDYSYYDTCGDCDDWTECETSSGPNVCVTPCTDHAQCFALFDSVRGRQYNGGCDVTEAQCVGFKEQKRMSGTFPQPQLQNFQAWAGGRGITVDADGVVTDWGPNWKKTKDFCCYTS